MSSRSTLGPTTRPCVDSSVSSFVVLLERDEPVPLLAAARADGTRHDDHRTDHAYTTRELLDAEHRVVESMHERAHADAARLSASRVATMLDTRPESQRLAPEQRQMVERLTTSGAGVEVVVGLGGAGKTFSLAAAREAWAAGGVEVRGCAIADAATRNLEREAGIESRTIATLKMWTSPEPGSGFEPQPERAFPPGGVLVVDEAGMVPTRDLAFLVDGCERHGTKLVLVGDHRQLPESDAGGSFKGRVHRFEPQQRISRLGTNRRQRHEWERAALADLRAGSVTDAISAYAQNDRITTRPDPARLRERLVGDWLDARKRNPNAAMIAYTREDVAHLNRLARAALDERGTLGTKRATFVGTEWARGDELICLRNQRALNVSNGTRGRVTHVGRSGVEIETAGGERLRIPRDYLQRGHAAHAYATTGHKSQGQTIKGEAFVLASEYASREWLYVAMSRATDATRIYIDTLDRDPATGRALTEREQRDAAIGALHDLASRSHAHTLASDYREATADRLDRNDLRRHLDRQRLTEQRGITDREREQRQRALREHLAKHPPRYLLPIIGSIPLDPTKREAWKRDAARLETHRRTHRLTYPHMTHQVGERVLGREQGRGRGMGRGR